MSVHDLSVYPDIKDLLEIPQDEPIFILRAQDRSSVETLKFYTEEQVRPGNDPVFMDNLRQVKDEFEHWQIENSEKVKRAD